MSPWQNLSRNAELHRARGVVELVIGGRPDDLRYAGTQRMAHGADAAVVNESGKSGQQGTERRVVDMNHALGQ
ncbi:MAG: hypothetical protein H6934_05925 [Burkholderiaceae bacterium]|nr:hypothetical protein [Burkholderiaceae bacterium]